ncbi:hypothetical protein SacmaDRAFT_5714 [Saccharomonospora marina XMU15]|uniref:Uncharacterized protein n=1 Tax=Saccharomonospora marina XMU15 TaxID=882083 RepID=H5XC24_9PSEU|nr:hypothetical protein SacmaDRAFT_5714 [Saccharomonospora marina XMU15]
MVWAGLAMLVVALGAVLFAVLSGAFDSDTESGDNGDSRDRDRSGRASHRWPGQLPSGTGSGWPGHVRSLGTIPSTRKSSTTSSAHALPPA